jgi:nicotinamidase-related amidase
MQTDFCGKGAFHATGLAAILAGLATPSLVFAGVTTEVRVQTILRKANDRGLVSLLAEDATESCFPAFKVATLGMIRARGAIVGWTATADQILQGLGVRSLRV